MKKVLFHTKRYTCTKPLVTLNRKCISKNKIVLNNGRTNRYYDVFTKNFGSNAMTNLISCLNQLALSIAHSSKGKLGVRYEGTTASLELCEKEEKDEDCNYDEPWGRTVIVFDHSHSKRIRKECRVLKNFKTDVFDKIAGPYTIHCPFNLMKIKELPPGKYELQTEHLQAQLQNAKEALPPPKTENETPTQTCRKKSSNYPSTPLDGKFSLILKPSIKYKNIKSHYMSNKKIPCGRLYSLPTPRYSYFKSESSKTEKNNEIEIVKEDDSCQKQKVTVTKKDNYNEDIPYSGSKKFKGKEAIIFSRSDKLKNRCVKNVLLLPKSPKVKKETVNEIRKEESEEADKKVPSQGQMENMQNEQSPKNDNDKTEPKTVATNKMTLFESVSTIPKEVFKALAPEISKNEENASNSNSICMKKGKMLIVFDHSKKGSKFKGLSKLYKSSSLPTASDLALDVKTMDKSVESPSKNDKTDVDESQIINNEKSLIGEIAVHENEYDIGSKDGTPCKIDGSDKVKVKQVSPRNFSNRIADMDLESIPNHLPNLMAKELKVNDLTNVTTTVLAEDANLQDDGHVDVVVLHKNVESLVKAPKRQINMLPKKFQKVKRSKKRISRLTDVQFKSSATRILMERSKQSLERLIKFNQDPQCGFISGGNDPSKTMSDVKEGLPSTTQVAVQTVKFEDHSPQSTSTDVKQNLKNQNTNEAPISPPYHMTLSEKMNFVLKPKDKTAAALESIKQAVENSLHLNSEVKHQEETQKEISLLNEIDGKIKECVKLVENINLSTKPKSEPEQLEVKHRVADDLSYESKQIQEDKQKVDNEIPLSNSEMDANIKEYMKLAEKMNFLSKSKNETAHLEVIPVEDNLPIVNSEVKQVNQNSNVFEKLAEKMEFVFNSKRKRESVRPEIEDNLTARTFEVQPNIESNQKTQKDVVLLTNCESNADISSFMSLTEKANFVLQSGIKTRPVIDCLTPKFEDHFTELKPELKPNLEIKEGEKGCDFLPNIEGGISEVKVHTVKFDEPHPSSEFKTTQDNNQTESGSAVCESMDNAITEYMKIEKPDFDLVPKIPSCPLEESASEQQVRHCEFNKFLSDPNEIGVISINSTRAFEWTEDVDLAVRKPLFTLGMVQPFENLVKISKQIKQRCNKVPPQLNYAIDLNIVQNNLIAQNCLQQNPKKENKETVEASKCVGLISTDPLEVRSFLKNVSNLIEMSQVNGEVIDDIVDITSNNQEENKNFSASEQLPDGCPVHGNCSPTEEPPTDISKIPHQLATSALPEVNQIEKSVVIPKTPISNELSDQKQNNPTELQIKQVQGTISSFQGVVQSENAVTMKLTETADKAWSAKKKPQEAKNSPNYVEAFRVENSIKPPKPIAKTVANERMKAFKDIYERFEKLGLYKKKPKKVLIQKAEIDIRKKSNTKTIKREIELQEKYRNTPEGKRLQEYFDTLRFKLTTSMKDDSKKKKMRFKKVLYSSKLGKLNPPTSPSKPSFNRRGTGDKSVV